MRQLGYFPSMSRRQANYDDEDGRHHYQPCMALLLRPSAEPESLEALASFPAWTGAFRTLVLSLQKVQQLESLLQLELKRDVDEAMEGHFMPQSVAEQARLFQFVANSFRRSVRNLAVRECPKDWDLVWEAAFCTEANKRRSSAGHLDRERSSRPSGWKPSNRGDAPEAVEEDEEGDERPGPDANARGRRRSTLGRDDPPDSLRRNLRGLTPGELIILVRSFDHLNQSPDAVDSMLVLDKNNRLLDSWLRPNAPIFALETIAKSFLSDRDRCIAASLALIFGHRIPHMPHFNPLRPLPRDWLKDFDSCGRNVMNGHILVCTIPLVWYFAVAEVVR
jgi:hypothetical protein